MNEKNREFHGYILDEWDGNTFQTKDKHPCQLCELEDICDRIADDLNKIEYFLCKSVNSKFKEEHPYAYFKKKE